MKIAVFDTETTGMVHWKIPSNRKEQPHMVELGAVLVDDQTQEIDEEFSVIIRPDGWVSCKEALEAHGITHEQAMDEGIPEVEALDMFIELWRKCGLRVAHNTTFDNRIIRIALMRYHKGLISDEIWKNRDLYYCTLVNARKVMGGKSGHTLAEAYLHFTGKTLEGAHRAMADTKACMEIYFKLNEQSQLGI